jgi:hypothetical protein
VADRAPVAQPTAAEYEQAMAEFGRLGLLDRLGVYARGAYGALKSPLQMIQHYEAPGNLREHLAPRLGTVRTDRSPLDKGLNYAGGYDWGIRPGVNPEDARASAKAYQLWDYGTRPHDSVMDYLENLAGLRAAERDRALNLDRRGPAMLDEAARFAVPKARGGLAQYRECSCHG